MADKSCVICGGTEGEGELLLEAPCGRHWVCPDDIASFFKRATQTESLFPPKCCGQMFMLQEYEDYVPFDVAWAFQIKEQGEYSILAKFRVYCANPPCAVFLHPSSHVTDGETKITYAICEGEDCGKLTCVGCKTLLEHGTQNHVCAKSEDEEKFKQTVNEKGYMVCNVCGATVELAEACNHITCECGHDFCYICGKDWLGLHGCPHYGAATYDEEGYNQGGYHRETGLNREGLTHRQEIARRRGEDPEAEDEEEEEDEDPDWQVLQHVTPEQRVAINTLEGEAREGALAQLQIELFETQGITFEQRPVRGQQQTDEPEEPEGGDEENIPPPDADEDIPLLDAEELDAHEAEGAGEGAPLPPHMETDESEITGATTNDDEIPWVFGDLAHRNETLIDDSEDTNNGPALEPLNFEHDALDAPTDTLLEAASLDSNASHVGSDVQERLVHDFPGPFVNGRDAEITPPTLSTSPATASEHGDPATPTGQELGDSNEPWVGVQEHKQQPYEGVSGAFPLNI